MSLYITPRHAIERLPYEIMITTEGRGDVWQAESFKKQVKDWVAENVFHDCIVRVFVERQQNHPDIAPLQEQFHHLRFNDPVPNDLRLRYLELANRQQVTFKVCSDDQDVLLMIKLAF